MKIVAIIFLLAVLPLLCVSLSAFCVIQIYRLVKRQVRLHNSISLVELKASRLHYWAFAFIIAFLALYTITQVVDPLAPDGVMFLNNFGIKKAFTNTALAFVFVMLVCLLGLMLVLANSRCAIVDRGIYTSFNYIEWYHLHDYIIDEANSVVVLTSNKNTFLSLSGITPPLKVAKNDISKLIFILNKNKNKFSTKIE